MQQSLWHNLMDILDFLLIAYLAWADREMLHESRTSRKLYEAFFAERTRWYAARNKKPRVESPEVAVITEIEMEDTTRREE